MEKYYLSSNPNAVPIADGIKLLESAEDLINLENSLVYCDSKGIINEIRELDAKNLIHLGCRDITPAMMFAAKVLRFGSNYLISSAKWSDSKYKTFKTFVPKKQIEWCKTHYTKITDYEDEELVKIFKSQMDMIKDSPQLGIDFETNDFPEMVGHFPLGLAIVDKINGFYYDFDMDSTYCTMKSHPKFFEELKSFVIEYSYKLYAFNVSFEIRCFYNMYKVFIKLQDTRAWCIVDGMKRNLKYGGQYYCESGSWDDDVKIEHDALSDSYVKMKSYDEFVEDYKLGNDANHECTRILYKINKDNPDFLPRYKKFYGKVWATGNQKKCGVYCCYDAVMDIYIYEEIRKIKLIDHYYSEDVYNVYLYNQYLSAVMEMSGIFIDKKLLKQLSDKMDVLIFNSALYVNTCLMKYKIEMLEANSGSGIEVTLNEKLSILLEKYSSTMFVQPDLVKLGKDFAKRFRKNPEAFEELVEKKYDELQFIISSWSDDEAFEKVSRSRKIFSEIGKKLYEEWGLKELWRNCNEQYIKLTDCNNKALTYWPSTEEELIRLMKIKSKKKGDELWKKKVPKEFIPEVNKYIYDTEDIRAGTNVATAIKSSLELRKCKAEYSRMQEAIKGRTLDSPIDPQYNWIVNKWVMTSPKDKKVAGELVQRYHQKYYALFAAWNDIMKSINRPELFTKEQYLNYERQMLSKFSDISTIPEFKKYFYESVEREETVEFIAKDTGKKRKTKRGTGEFYDKEIVWSLKGYLRAKRHYPWKVPIKLQTDPWRKEHEVNNHRLDEEFDVRLFELHKFLGYFKLCQACTKMRSTSIKSVMEDSRKVKLIDPSRVQRYRRKYVDDDLIKYFVKIGPNLTITGRWTSNIHSVFPATEDTRVAMIPKLGTHYILPRIEGKEYKDNDTVYKIDGMNFRPDDEVILSNSSKKRVRDLTDSDTFDPDWIKMIKEEDAKSNVNWSFSDECYEGGK